MMKAYTVGHDHSDWQRMEPVLLVASLLFFACTTVFDTAVMYVTRIGIAGVCFVSMMIILQSYVIWLYFMRVVPILRKHTTEFPGSVKACAALFTVATLLSSALAGIGMYILLSNHG